jgi:type II secretory pathway predicted ATPase ExeA
MPAYLKYFELKQSPFEGKAQSKVVLGTRALRDAFKAIRDGLEEGSARICVSGGPGLGKTSLARSLPKLLGDTARVVLVRDPSVPWQSLRGQIAKRWGKPMDSREIGFSKRPTSVAWC